jgi:hypothetical protein
MDKQVDMDRYQQGLMVVCLLFKVQGQEAHGAAQWAEGVN